MSRRCARMVERTCCAFATYIPLIFVYGLTTWGIWVVVEIGMKAPKRSWLGTGSSILGLALYVLLNWSYTIAVFTDPGSTTNRDGYGLLPTTQGHPPTTSFTVKSNGEIRFCKKCQARKPDRAHHCSTCRRCVLKMDHHCPWLATCLGLRNYKPFLLFLVYTTLLCLYAFAVSGTWVWSEVIQEDVQQFDNILPVNFIILSILSGIIGIVVGIFTGWHIMLATKGQTTIECLEKTRYLSPLRQTYRATHNPANRLPPAAQQFVDFHTNALPGITRPEEGEERRPSQDYNPQRPHDGSMPVQLTYEERERQQSRLRYEEYLDEQDSTKLPNAFDLGWKKNLLHLLGPNPWLWAIPICNTTGDGWSWEASPRWMKVRDRIRREREEQRAREINAGWGGDDAFAPSPYAQQPSNGPLNGTPRRAPSKADRVLGRDPNLYADGSQSLRMSRLSTQGKSLDDELLDTDDDDNDNDDDEDLTERTQYAANSNTNTNTNTHAHINGGGVDTHPNGSRDEAERRALDVVTNGRAWSRGGASGMLQKGSTQSSSSKDAKGGMVLQDEGVD
ncbi:palmitoyltransferase for Vac8p [Conoideocrella luteorostrata]|uniref:Palmitoyltransferase n=1 Tax=Conoideocrella luteorostrata TaxID=1105319 RepID=A0AAJ0CUK0_9HYPO|nr:palmitoyltransferase for Vac8p [Conoideocrella luteorostrata]